MLPSTVYLSGSVFDGFLLDFGDNPNDYSRIPI